MHVLISKSLKEQKHMICHPNWKRGMFSESERKEKSKEKHRTGKTSRKYKIADLNPKYQ